MSTRLATADRDRVVRFKAPRTTPVERWYAVQLRKVARQIDELVNGQVQPEATPSSYVPGILQALQAYAPALTGWATSVADRMIRDVDRVDRREWYGRSQEISKLLEAEIQGAPTGATYRKLQAEQVSLITSLPTKAAERVNKLAIEGVIKGQRADQIAAAIMETGEVTKSRANLIARTEVARAQANLTEARARYVGSPGYTWQTVGDSDVRHDHKILNGTFHSWDDPPISDVKAGIRAHPGCIFNCRCFSLPSIPNL